MMFLKKAFHNFVGSKKGKSKDKTSDSSQAKATEKLEPHHPVSSTNEPSLSEGTSAVHTDGSKDKKKDHGLDSKGTDGTSHCSKEDETSGNENDSTSRAPGKSKDKTKDSSQTEDGAQFPRSQNSEDSHMVSLGNRDVPTADPQQMESCQKRSSLLVKDLPFLVYSKVCKMLDYKRDFYDDFRMLAEGLGMDRDYIRLLEQKDNPTDLIFSNDNQTLKVSQLIEALKRIERLDVVEVLEDWAQNKDKA